MHQASNTQQGTVAQGRVHLKQHVTQYYALQQHRPAGSRCINSNL
jgi:hypothetical protein